jgi:TadE-like protein/PilZ domain
MRFLTGFHSKFRHAVRCANPKILAYYWEGGVPSGHPIKEISSTGAFISTPQRWYIGTILTLTLQSDAVATQAADTLLISCRVARHEADGVGVSFLFTNAQERKALEKFVRRIRAHGNGNHARGNGDGQALIEYALVVPMLFFLIVGAVDFGGFIYSWVTVANAARAIADYAALNGSWIGFPADPTGAQLTAVFNADTASLPNTTSTNPSLSVCRLPGPTAVIGSCSSPVLDPA